MSNWDYGQAEQIANEYRYSTEILGLCYRCIRVKPDKPGQQCYKCDSDDASFRDETDRLDVFENEGS